MLKKAFLSVVALSALAAGATGAFAQCTCSGSGAIVNPTVVENVSQSMQSSSLTVARPQAQIYRRFSYQPSAQAGRSNVSHKKQQWEYSKADPRRYNH